MIVNTRYRDISWEEVLSLGHKQTFPQAPERWAKKRGQPVSIEAIPALVVATNCTEPHFKVHPHRLTPEGYTLALCWHTVEIGD